MIEQQLAHEKHALYERCWLLIWVCLPWRRGHNDWRWVWCNCYDCRVFVRLHLNNITLQRARDIWGWGYAHLPIDWLVTFELNSLLLSSRLSYQFTGQNYPTRRFLTSCRWLNVGTPLPEEESWIVAVFASEKNKRANQKACYDCRNNDSSIRFGHFSSAFQPSETVCTDFVFLNMYLFMLRRDSGGTAGA